MGKRALGEINKEESLDSLIPPLTLKQLSFGNERMLRKSRHRVLGGSSVSRVLAQCACSTSSDLQRFIKRVGMVKHTYIPVHGNKRVRSSRSSWIK